MPDIDSTPRLVRRRGTKAETRHRLLLAVLKLLQDSGETSLSTVSATREAGMVQSAFYQHFSNLDECLAEAAGMVASQIRDSIANARRAMYQTSSGSGRDLANFFLGVLALAAQQRSVMLLFLRYRTDPLALNGVMYRLGKDLETDLAKDLNEVAGKHGLSGLSPRCVEVVAANLMAASLASVDMSLTNRDLDHHELAKLLAAFSEGACAAVALSFKS